MTTNNSLDPYNHEGQFIHSEAWHQQEQRLAQERAAKAGDTNRVGGTSSSLPAAPINAPSPRKSMALDIKVCLVVGVVCIIILALMAHW
jgi:hypothetical protein